MSSNGWYGSPEHIRNEAARLRAAHDGEPWSQVEIDLVLEWDHSDEQLDMLCDMLGRSRMAIRVKASNLKHGRMGRYTLSETTTTVTTRTYSTWPADEQSPWYV